MNTTLSTQDWYPVTGSYEPRDQQLDLHGGYRAGIGPRGRHVSDGWWWAVAEHGEVADSGWAPDEAGVKEAVADWAEADLLVQQITEDLLSAAFDAHGHASAAVDRLERAVAATTQIEFQDAEQYQ
jgi:hypothetical protein